MRLFSVVPYFLVAIVVIPVAVVIMWGLKSFFGPAMPDNLTVRVILSLASIMLAFFVVSAGFLLLFLTIGILGRLLRHRFPVLHYPKFIPTDEGLTKWFSQTTDPDRVENILKYLKLIYSNIEKFNLLRHYRRLEKLLKNRRDL